MKLNLKTLGVTLVAGSLVSGMTISAATSQTPKLSMTQKESKVTIDLYNIGDSVTALEITLESQDLHKVQSITTSVKDSYVTQTVNDDTNTVTYYIVSNNKDVPLDFNQDSLLTLELSDADTFTLDSCDVKYIKVGYTASSYSNLDITSSREEVDTPEQDPTPEPTPPAEDPEPTPPVEDPTPEPTPPVEDSEPTPPAEDSTPEPIPPVEDPEPTPPVEDSTPEQTPPVDSDTKPEQTPTPDIKPESKPETQKPPHSNKPGNSTGGSNSSSGSSNSNKPSNSTTNRDQISITTEKVEQKDKEEQTSISFVDTSTHWANDSISRMAELGIITGYQDGSFKPNATITRGEFAALLSRAFSLSPTGNTQAFKDVQHGKWYTDAVNALYSNGITSGRPNGTFGVNDKITNEEISVMLHRTITTLNLKVQMTSNTSSEFKDSDKISLYAQTAVQELHKMGIVNGRPDGSFAPQSSTTRAQVAVMIDRLLSSVSIK